MLHVCYSIDIIDSSVDEHIEEILCKDGLQLSLIQGEGKDVDNLEVETYIERLDATKEIVPQSGFEELKQDNEARLKNSIEEPPVLE